jgi:hypothetical protein
LEYQPQNLSFDNKTSTFLDLDTPTYRGNSEN